MRTGNRTSDGSPSISPGASHARPRARAALLAALASGALYPKSVYQAKLGAR